MYRIEYCDKEKDSTYDDAYFTTMDNGNTKWNNYYSYLQEKYDLCFNIKSITIDVEDIKNMKYDCFSNGILLKFYLMCKSKHVFAKYDQVSIPNNSIFTEELIYNILKSDWIINEELVDSDDDELKRRETYFKALIEVSEDNRDIKIQFRNKLYEYFVRKYEYIKNHGLNPCSDDKILKLEKHKTNSK